MMSNTVLDDGFKLIKLEKVIEKGKSTFIEVGTALEEIRDGKLYREKYGTFEDYCLKRWGWKKSHAYRMLEATRVAKTSPIGDKIKTESQARALSKVPVSEHVEVMKSAEKSGPITAKSIAESAKPEPPVIELDSTGMRVPRLALPYWNRRGEVQSLLNAITQIKSAVKKAQDNKDPLWHEVSRSFSTVIHDLENAYNGIKMAMPYAVCFSCQGKKPDTCRDCGGRGMVSKLFHDQSVTAQAKELRKKAIEI